MDNSAYLSSGGDRAFISEEKNLIGILRRRARKNHARNAYIFLPDGKSGLETLTFGELDSRARAIAIMLRSVNAMDEPVILLYPPGLEFVSGLMGCLYSRAVAVPIPSSR